METEAHHILLIEDCDVSRRICEILLKACGHRVTMAREGRAAIRLLMENPEYDMVISDLDLPDIDGYTIARWLRRNEQLHDLKRTPMVAASAFDRARVWGKVERAGMDGFLSKPLNLEDLRCTLGSLLA